VVVAFKLEAGTGSTFLTLQIAVSPYWVLAQPLSLIGSVVD